MKAIWSFWSVPFLKETAGASWPTRQHHFFSWVLSVETSRGHFAGTRLVTDDEGARLLVDRLGLRFDEVTLELNDIDPELSRWWALGKLYAYRAQQTPFLHIDYDAFLWKPLPAPLLRAPVIGQSPEYVEQYRLDKYHYLRAEHGWLPPEVDWYQPGGRYAVDCGILGANNTALMRHYADNAVRLIEHEANRGIWKRIGEDNIVVEQYYLSACVEYYQEKEPGRFGPVSIGYLFDTPEGAFDEEQAQRHGFTHLLGHAKQHGGNAAAVEGIVKRRYPDYHERCLALAGG